MEVTVKATPTSIRYEKDSFCILACKCKSNSALGGATQLSVKGNVIGDAAALLDQEVIFTGKLEENQYGFTVAFTNYAINESIDYFWVSVAGVSPIARKHLYELYGKQPDWLDGKDSKEKLVKVNGIKEKTAAKILARWKEYQGIRKLTEQLAPYDISQKQIANIYNHFKDNSSKVLAETPYRLTEVRGMGFKISDSIARRLGVDERSNGRKQAAIIYVLTKFAENGSTAVHHDGIYQMVNEEMIMSDGALAFPNKEEFVGYLKSVSSDKESSIVRVIGDMDFYAHEKFRQMEGYIFETFLKLKAFEKAPLVMTAGEALTAVSEYDKGAEFKLGEQQRQGVVNCLTKPCTVSIVGYAGTGKSTVSKVVLNLLAEKFKILHSDVKGCALSGVAANRIKNQSGYDAVTIHALLGWNGKAFEFDENNQLAEKIIILDEAGMVDTWLFYSLLKAIDFKRTKLIILGDPAQLMAVGAGQPFIDLLNSKLLPYVELTQIFRQSEDQALPIVAQSIRKAEKPSFLDSYTDVTFQAVQPNSDRLVMNKQITEELLSLALERSWKGNYSTDDENLWNYIAHLQVITPRKSGILGADELSPLLRVKLLPSLSSAVVFKDAGLPLTSFDKVIHLKNTDMTTTDGDEVRVYNGQLGVVVAIDAKEDKVTVRYPLNKYSVEYDRKDVVNGLIGYAWALTVHKTQGAEFSHVVLPMTMSHYTMLNNRLFYTAVTRMRDHITILGEMRAVNFAATNSESARRVTLLALYRRKLAEIVKPSEEVEEQTALPEENNQEVENKD